MVKTNPVDPQVRKAVCRGVNKCLNSPSITIKKRDDSAKPYLKTADELPSYVRAELRDIGYGINGVSIHGNAALIHLMEL